MTAALKPLSEGAEIILGRHVRPNLVPASVLGWRKTKCGSHALIP